jgi:transcription elongation GreA/GreB family factor
MLARVMATSPPKQALKDELVRLLQADLDVLERAHRAVLEAATHEEAKPENDKDTRALEQSYLARGQAMRVEELRAGLAAVQAMAPRAFGEGAPAALGALIVVDEGGQERRFFLAPHGGGAKLAGGRVQVITPESPLGRALLGKCAGDECEVAAGGRARELALLSVD